MTLKELDPAFVQLRAGKSYAVVHSMVDADGLLFRCPHCVKKPHKALLWRKHVLIAPGDKGKAPPRWTFAGTGLEDLTVGPASLRMCGRDFFIRNGEIG